MHSEAQDYRLNTPLQQRHDELERMQAALRSMPIGGRLGAGNSGQPSDPPSVAARRIGGQLPINMGARGGLQKGKNTTSVPPHPVPDVRAKVARQAFDYLSDEADEGNADDIYAAKRAVFGEEISIPRPKVKTDRTHPSETSIDDTPAMPRPVHAGTLSYILNELRTCCPMLSPNFSCNSEDAVVLLNAISTSRKGNAINYGREHLLPAQVASDHTGYALTLEDKCTTLEAEVRSLTSRLERRSEECDKLRDDVGEARQKVRAIESSAKQQQGIMSQRREEMRKQLLTEEGRTAKLTHQNKLLQQELDKLKIRLTNAK